MNSPAASQLTCTEDSELKCFDKMSSPVASQLTCSEETKLLSKCYSKLNAKLRVSRTPRNQFRLFYNCPSNSSDDQCGFFQWADESLPTGDKHLDEINCTSDECMRLHERIDQIREEHKKEKIAWDLEKAELMSQLSTVKAELDQINKRIKTANEAELMPPCDSDLCTTKSDEEDAVEKHTA